MRNKPELRALIGDGQLDAAVEGAVEYAEAAADVDTLNGIIALKSDLAQAKDLWHKQQLSFEEFARASARINAALLARVSELPDAPTRQAAESRLKEEGFRWLVFYLFLAAKLGVLAWAAFLWQTEGFLNTEAFSLFNALLPGMAVSASLMFRSLFKSSTDADAPRRYVRARFRALVVLVFAGYVAAQLFLTLQKVKGNLSFELASISFAAVETALAHFMGDLVEGLFKR